jgi:hypothetical protein
MLQKFLNALGFVILGSLLLLLSGATAEPFASQPSFAQLSELMK